jgi:hypothetical protein
MCNHFGYTGNAHAKKERLPKGLTQKAIRRHTAVWRQTVLLRSACPHTLCLYANEEPASFLSPPIECREGIASQMHGKRIAERSG